MVRKMKRTIEFRNEKVEVYDVPFLTIEVDEYDANKLKLKCICDFSRTGDPLPIEIHSIFTYDITQEEVMEIVNIASMRKNKKYYVKPSGRIASLVYEFKINNFSTRKLVVYDLTGTQNSEVITGSVKALIQSFPVLN